MVKISKLGNLAKDVENKKLCNNIIKNIKRFSKNDQYFYLWRAGMGIEELKEGKNKEIIWLE